MIYSKYLLRLYKSAHHILDHLLESKYDYYC